MLALMGSMKAANCSSSTTTKSAPLAKLSDTIRLSQRDASWCISDHAMKTCERMG